jgi:hypothetical protein
VSRLVRNADVELELGSGAVMVRWPGRDVRAGPLTARAVVDGTEHVSTDSAGAWRVETGTGAGRPGAWARWVPTGADDRHAESEQRGLGLAVHVPTEGGAVVVDATWTGPPAAAMVSGLAVQGAATDAPGEVVEDEDELAGATTGVRVLVS